MKTIATTIIILLSLSSQAQITNSGFENWTNSLVDDWTAEYDFGLTQSTDAHTGSYAAVIHNWYTYLHGTLEYRGAVTQYPDNFTGMYKYISAPFSAGTVNIVVVSTEGDTIIDDMGYFGPETEWTGFSVMLTQDVVPTDPADSIFIYFTNSTEQCPNGDFDCDFLHLDDLSLSFVSAALTEVEAISMSLFPNPANDILNIQFNEMITGESVELFILDMTGKIVLNQVILDQEVTVDVQALEPGTYIAKFMTQDKGVVHRQLVIQ